MTDNAGSDATQTFVAWIRKAPLRGAFAREVQATSIEEAAQQLEQAGFVVQSIEEVVADNES